MLNLLERLVIELVCVARVALSKDEEQIGTDDETENVAMLKRQRTISVALSGYVRRDLRILQHVVLSVFFNNHSDFLLSTALGARFERSLKLLLVCEANMDWIKHLVEAIVHADDLQVLEIRDGSLNLLVCLEGFK